MRYYQHEKDSSKLTCIREQEPATGQRQRREKAAIGGERQRDEVPFLDSFGNMAMHWNGARDFPAINRHSRPTQARTPLRAGKPNGGLSLAEAVMALPH